MADEISRGRRVWRMVLGKTGGNVASVVLLSVCAYVFLIDGMRFFLVPSESMEPTLLTGDYLVTFKEAPYHRGDIVVLADPEEAGAFIVKRIVALGGETVCVNGGMVWIDGQPLDEPYIKSLPRYQMDPVRIPDGCVFVLGDNRNKSQDSHAWKEHWQYADRIVGKVAFIYSPLNRFGRVRSHAFE